MNDYEEQCRLGRERASRLIEDCRASADIPRLVREIRSVAADTSGIGVGFLHALSEYAMKGAQKKSFAELGANLA